MESGNDIAFVFNRTNEDHRGMYAMLPEDSDMPLSPDDQALLMGVYPATMTDFDLAATIAALPSTTMNELNISVDGERSTSNGLRRPDLLPTALPDGHYPHNHNQQQHLQQMHRQQMRQHPAPQSSSPPGGYFDPSMVTNNSYERYRSQSDNASPTSSGHASDVATRDSEDILNAPVKSLTEEEKKLRRRAQVAKSARKHRNRQKEELARLREQVQMLQDQMAKMRPHDGYDSPSTIKMEKEVITQHRKRKKVEDEDDDDEEAALESSLANHSAFTNVVQEVMHAASLPSSDIQHWFNHLPVDTLQRTEMVHHIADKRLQLAFQYLYNEFEKTTTQYPQMDIKLNSNGPDLEIKLLRAKQVPGFSHLEVADAAWNSIFNFEFDIPKRFSSYVVCERLMELDENTRYGRTIVPLLKNDDGEVVYLHSYFVIRRKVTEKYVVLTWDSIDVDDLYPSESSETVLRNDEVGCTLFETEILPNGEVQTLFRTVIHSTPPVNAIAQPRGKINEAFLTVFCRNADIVEQSARNLMNKKYPGRNLHCTLEQTAHAMLMPSSSL